MLSVETRQKRGVRDQTSRRTHTCGMEWGARGSPALLKRRRLAAQEQEVLVPLLFFAVLAPV